MVDVREHYLDVMIIVMFGYNVIRIGGIYNIYVYVSKIYNGVSIYQISPYGISQYVGVRGKSNLVTKQYLDTV